MESHVYNRTRFVCVLWFSFKEWRNAGADFEIVRPTAEQDIVDSEMCSESGVKVFYFINTPNINDSCSRELNNYIEPTILLIYV